jgi:hypothetical protein
MDYKKKKAEYLKDAIEFFEKSIDACEKALNDVDNMRCPIFIQVAAAYTGGAKAVEEAQGILDMISDNCDCEKCCSDKVVH